jgi:biotin synthase-like enzyme
VKSVDDVVETALAAKSESDVTFVHLNTGYAGDATLDGVMPYAKALKERVGVLVGVQSTPTLDFARYDQLKALGVDHLSFCYEFQDPDVFEKWCPGKARTLGQETYFRALEHCSKLFGRGTCAGEIIAGVEPIERTLEAIDWIASVGAFPTVCIFRPTIGSQMEHLPSPDPDQMETVMRAVWDACRRHMVPVGMAPNVHVSLVVNPEDAADLVENPGPADLAWRAALAVGRVAAKPVFARRMRKRHG